MCATTCASNQRLNRENDTKQEAPATLDIIACLDDIKMQIEIVPMTTRKKVYHANLNFKIQEEIKTCYTCWDQSKLTFFFLSL